MGLCAKEIASRDGLNPRLRKSPAEKLKTRTELDLNGVIHLVSDFRCLPNFLYLISGPCVTCKDITPLKDSILQPPPCKINSKSQRVCSIKCAEGYHNFGLNEGKTGTKDRF